MDRKEWRWFRFYADSITSTSPGLTWGCCLNPISDGECGPFSPVALQSHLTPLSIRPSSHHWRVRPQPYLFFSNGSRNGWERHFPIIECWLCREKPHSGLLVSSGCCGWNEADLCVCVCVCVCMGGRGRERETHTMGEWGGH